MSPRPSSGHVGPTRRTTVAKPASASGAVVPVAAGVLSVDAAGTWLGGLSRSSMFRLIKSGALPSFTVGSRRFVRLCDVEAYAARAVEAAGQS